MSILGKVSVTTATVVKVGAVVGMVASCAFLVEPALSMMVLGLSSETAANVTLPLLGLAASVAGWEFADWVDGKLHVSTNKAAQDAELARLQAHHGHAL